jgi:multiple sugar transport system ATP-binding protein
MNFLGGEIDGDAIKLPFGSLPIPDTLRSRLQSGPGGGRRGVIVGLRPEDFEDASLVGDQSGGITFKAKIEVLESMGSEFYAYFSLESEKVSSRELEELAHDAGAADLPTQEGSQVVARLEAASPVRQGQETELWFNSEHLHLFDPETGKTLLGSNGDRSGGSVPSAGTGTPPPAGAGSPQAGGDAPPATGADAPPATGGGPAAS